jgi:hypothetical protein
LVEQVSVCWIVSTNRIQNAPVSRYKPAELGFVFDQETHIVENHPVPNTATTAMDTNKKLKLLGY